MSGFPEPLELRCAGYGTRRLGVSVLLCATSTGCGPSDGAGFPVAIVAAAATCWGVVAGQEARVLASVLFDLLAERRIRAMQRGWAEIPPWVFASKAGTPLDHRNVTRSWHRVRRRAQQAGVRPFKPRAAPGFDAPLVSLERETGFEPATLSLGS